MRDDTLLTMTTSHASSPRDAATQPVDAAPTAAASPSAAATLPSTVDAAVQDGPAAAPTPSSGGEPASSGRVNPVSARSRTDDRRSVAVLGDRVLVHPPSDAERRSKGGILIPATAASIDRKGIWGEAIGVGPHVRHVSVGDEVLYVPEDAIEVDVQGDPYLIVRERDIHAVGSSRSDGATGLYL